MAAPTAPRPKPKGPIVDVEYDGEEELPVEEAGKKLKAGRDHHADCMELEARIEDALLFLEDMLEREGSRERSITKTKLEEAHLWLGREKLRWPAPTA